MYGYYYSYVCMYCYLRVCWLNVVLGSVLPGAHEKGREMRGSGHRNIWSHSTLLDHR